MSRVCTFGLLLTAYAGMLLCAIFGVARGDYGTTAAMFFWGAVLYPMWEDAFDVSM